MMKNKPGAQISSRSFLTSLGILFLLMLVAGILTQIVPQGSYTRQDLNGREVVMPGSYQPSTAAGQAYPIWRWFTAPLEVLGGPDAATVILIIVFLLLVGTAFAVLDQSGVMAAAVQRIVRRTGSRKHILLLAITLFFMLLGAFFGIFEEVVPLVPVMIALSYSLGWDVLVGLGMSILATNVGFSAAISNPFTIGVAQKLAGLPLFSGVGFRALIFLVFYFVLAAFLLRYARRIEKDPRQSLAYGLDPGTGGNAIHAIDEIGDQRRINRALTWLVVFLALILAILLGGALFPLLVDVALPLVGLLFFIGGLGAGLIAHEDKHQVWKAAGQGALGIAPAIPLILMAASVKYIVASGGILDTLLHSAEQAFANTAPFAAAILVFILALIIEIFVPSGSAKAFLLMPILLPLADLVGITRQLTVTAYCFGDGFTNMAYPTNPVLLICLGLTVVSYPRWMRWTLPLWAAIAMLSLLFIGIGLAIQFGPF